MIYLKLIVINLLGSRTRSLLSIACIAFSVAALFTMITTFQGAVAKFSDILCNDSELIVLERDASHLFSSNVPDQVVNHINAWPMVDYAKPFLFALVSGSNHPIIPCFGVAPSDRRIVNTLWLEGRREQFESGGSAVVLGQRTAEFLQARVGDRVQFGHGDFHVVGIVSTANGFEDGGAFMPLIAAQTIFHKQGASTLATVKLRSNADAAAFKRKVRANYPELIALEHDEFNQSYAQFKKLRAFAEIVGACDLLFGGLTIAISMMMSVRGRTRDIAILRVNGWSSGQVAGVILGEASLLSFAGAAFGLVLGLDVILALRMVPSWHGLVDANIQLYVIVVVAMVSCLASVAGVVYPLLYAIRLRAL